MCQKENTDYEPGKSQPVYNSRVDNYENEQGKDQYYLGNDVMTDIDDIIQQCNPKQKDILEEAVNLTVLSNFVDDPPDKELRNYQCETCSTYYKHREQRRCCRRHCKE